MKKDLRIVFMGTPDFAVGILDKLVSTGNNIVGVITAPDKPAGRGRKINQSAVKKYAVEKGLNILQPTNLKSEDFLNELASLNADLQIVVAFRMLPKVVWQMPSEGTFNLHASLLPDYRGAAPIHWAIINGEPKTGVTTFFIDEKIDTGAIILKSETPIGTDETVGQLHDKLMHIGADLVVKTVNAILEGTVKTVVQPDKAPKEAPKLFPENCRIDWTATLDTIYNKVRGLNPFPAAWTELHNGDEVIQAKIYDVSKEVTSHSFAIGTIITTKKQIKVAVDGGYLIIEKLKLAGKRAMRSIDLLNGFDFDSSSKMV